MSLIPSRSIAMRSMSLRSGKHQPALGLRNWSAKFLRGFDPLLDDEVHVLEGGLFGRTIGAQPGSSGTSAMKALSSWLPQMITPCSLITPLPTAAGHQNVCHNVPTPARERWRKLR